MIVPSKIKPIQNVALCTAAMQEAINRRPEQDGIVVFSGPTGFGKTYAACYVANTFHCIYGMYEYLYDEGLLRRTR
jgi:superfamily II DNA or RNA helicase